LPAASADRQASLRLALELDARLVAVGEGDAGGFQGVADGGEGAALRATVSVLKSIKRSDWYSTRRR